MLAIAVISNRPKSSANLRLVSTSPGGSQPPEDTDIIKGIREGQASAAVALYDAVGPAISATLVQILGNSDRDHDDLCQLALMRVVDTIVQNKFGERCSLKTWANVLASRLALDELRRRHRERLVLDRDAEHETHRVAAPASESPERSLYNSQQLVALRRALSRLKPVKAEAVLLFDVMGHDLEEVARLTNVSVAAAQSRVVRGRQELRCLLQAELPGGES